MKNVSSANPLMGSVDALVSALYMCFNVLPAFSHAKIWPSDLTALIGSLAFATLFGVTSVAMFMGWRSMWVLQYGAVLALVLLWILVLGFGHGDLRWR